MTPPTLMEWTRGGSPWSQVPTAAPLWGTFTHEQRAELAAGREVLLDSGTKWRVPEASRPVQVALF